MSRVLGIDLGTRRVGVALAVAGVAQPHAVLDATAGDLAEAIAELAKGASVEEIVVGHPLRLDSSSGPEAFRAEGLAAELRAATGVPVVLWDERLTTAQAERSLLGAGMRRAARRRVVDKVAAALMLQSYLDARRSGSASGLPEP